MGFVKSPEEVARIEAILAAPRFFNVRELQVEFLTRADTVARLLPPGLEPAAEPLAIARVGRFDSDFIGSYEGGSLQLAARHGDIEGRYVLAIYMTTLPAIVYGREIFGEPKKDAQAELDFGTSRMRASLSRRGARLVEIEATLDTDLPQAETATNTFNYRTWMRCDGRGLEGEVVLTLARFSAKLHVCREGTGTVRLRGTVHDPLDEVPVVGVRRARYFEGELAPEVRELARIPAQKYEAFAFSRYDDWTQDRASRQDKL